MTKTLSMFELEVALPDGVSIEVAPPEATREVRVLEGASAATVASTIERAAIAVGFAATRTAPRDTVLRRDQQALYLFQRTDATLVVRIEDPNAFPVAQVSDVGVRIREIDVAFMANKIVPGREQHIEGSREWSADWSVFGPSAADLSGQLHAAFLAMGLRGNGLWAPPEGIDRWKVEAYSADLLLQAEVFARPDHCELKIHLVTS